MLTPYSVNGNGNGASPGSRREVDVNRPMGGHASWDSLDEQKGSREGVSVKVEETYMSITSEQTDMKELAVKTEVKIESSLRDEGFPQLRVQPSKPIDAQAYLNFEMEDDKKFVKKQEEEEQDDSASDGSYGSREASTSSLKEDSEEPEKTARKPGAPASIAHLPAATEEALDTFDELEQSIYQNKQMGLAHQQEESMACDCVFNPDTDDPEDACGDDCINRLTQVECLAGDCRCKKFCRNQRFQRRQYASIDIVKTEKKGYGVRARTDLEKDAFVYEYIGEIIGEKAFQKRMRDYFDEGIEHFYFMMLQRDEFIDATKRGGKGRFLNHSCAPNCYVAKWVVGSRLRMGIFTKRKVYANEELTFNYNVDRYGHDAQECYCGEPNCVGFIGGKTQTDIAGMDDLYLDALGITAAVNALGLKGSKKKKSRKLDEDYFPDMTAIPLEDVPKVASAIRQATSNRRIITKLLERILLSEDPVVQRALMRLHGFSLMSSLLHEYPSDNEIIVAVLGTLAKWPLITRNKLSSTNIESTIEKIAKTEDQPAISEPAKELLQMWDELVVGYRIPKAVQDAIDAEGGSRKRSAQSHLEDVFARRSRLRLEDEQEQMPQPVAIELAVPVVEPTRTRIQRPDRILPPHWEELPLPEGSVFQKPTYLCTLTKAVYEEFPSRVIVAYESERYRQSLQIDINDIIAKARAESQAKAAHAAALAAAEEEAAKAAKQAKQEQRLLKESQSKEKKMYRLFSTVVIKTMSKYKKYLDHDQFKRRAKEVCQIMCEKEKKSSHFQGEKYDSLSSDKEAKLKKYVKEFMTKLLTRKGIKVSSSSTASPKVKGKEHVSKDTTTKSDRMSLLTPDTPSNEADDGENDMDLGEDDQDEVDLINELMDTVQ